MEGGYHIAPCGVGGGNFEPARRGCAESGICRGQGMLGRKTYYRRHIQPGAYLVGKITHTEGHDENKFPDIHGVCHSSRLTGGCYKFKTRKGTGYFLLTKSCLSPSAACPYILNLRRTTSPPRKIISWRPRHNRLSRCFPPEDAD